MNISIVGSGMVGGSLARAWAKRGHTISLAGRNPEKAELRALGEEIDTRPTRLEPAAVAGAEVVVLAVPADNVVEAALALGGLVGHIVVDPANPIAAGFDGLTVGTDTSRAGQLAAAVPEARVVKAFNTIGAHFFDSPDFGGESPSMLVAGDDPDAKAVVASLAGNSDLNPSTPAP